MPFGDLVDNISFLYSLEGRSRVPYYYMRQAVDWEKLFSNGCWAMELN